MKTSVRPIWFLSLGLFLAGAVLIAAGHVDNGSVSDDEAARIVGGNKYVSTDTGCGEDGRCATHSSYRSDDSGSPMTISGASCSGRCGTYLYQYYYYQE